MDEFDVTIIRYVFKNAYFLRSTPVTFDYSQAAAQTWSITFGADKVDMWSHEEGGAKLERQSFFRSAFS